MTNGSDLQLDFIKQQFADSREQVNSLKQQMQDLSEQIRGLNSTLHDSSTEVLVRLTSIEGWQTSHEKLDAAKYEAAEVQNLQRESEIKELAVSLGQNIGRFEEVQKGFGISLKTLQDAFEQIKGVKTGLSTVWKWLGAGATLVLVILNIVHLIGGKV